MGALLTHVARAALLLAVAVSTGCGDLRVTLAVFNTVAEARAAGAIAAGWVPEGIPTTASELRAGYMPDGRHWGVFAFTASDSAAVRALTREEVPSGTLTLESPPGRLEFWPRILRASTDVEQVRRTGFRVYRGSDGRTYAINWGQGRAYYWK